MTTKQKQIIQDPNPGVLSLKIQELVLEGWRIDPDMPLTLLGFLWEIGFTRDATDAQLASDAAEAAKPSRAEILAKARAAKAEKKAEQPQAEKEDSQSE